MDRGNHRGGDDGTEKRAASDFVNAGDESRARRPCDLLVFKGAFQALEKAKFQRGLRDGLFAGFLGELSFRFFGRGFHSGSSSNDNWFDVWASVSRRG